MYENAAARLIARAMAVVPVDKQLHAMWSMFGTLALAALLAPATAALVVLFFGIAWESATAEANTMREHLLDVVANAVGVAAGLCFAASF